MKVLDYEGLKQVVGKIKGLIDKKADKVDLEKFKEGSKFLDTREKNENPEFYIKNYPQNIVREFKRTSVMGLSEKLKDTYCYVITVFGWANLTGGNPCQYSISSNGADIYYRVGIDKTRWSSWRRVLDDTNLKTKLSQLSQDSTHRLVTDAEKTKWNAKLDNITNVDSSKSKTKGISNATKWASTDTVRNLENWIGDFDSRSRENKTAIGQNKTNIDNLNSRIGNELVKEKDVRKWAAEAANADLFFAEQNKLGQMLNDSYGTSLSTNIKNLDDLINSGTALRSILSNTNIARFTILSRNFYGKLVYNANAMNALLDSMEAMKLVIEEEYIMKLLSISTVAINAMNYKGKTLTKGQRVSGGKYIIIDSTNTWTGNSTYNNGEYIPYVRAEPVKTRLLHGLGKDFKKFPRYCSSILVGHGENNRVRYFEIK